MNKFLMLAAGTVVLSLAASGAMAQGKKELAVVVKGVDNPFFEQINLGCQQWNADNPNSEYICTYQGPASSADEQGEVQMVEDLLTKGVAGIAISPSNAAAMATMLRRVGPTMPVMTVDADVLTEDASLRTTYLGTNNYDMGVAMATQMQRLKPSGGTVCLQLGNVGAANINARAAGIRETLGGAGTERLTGQGGWTEIEACPVFTNDQPDVANNQMTEVLQANADLDAFILVGGWAQFAPQAYRQTTDGVMDRISSGDLIVVAGDVIATTPALFAEGRSHAQIAQRPFEMGYRSPEVLIQIINGEDVPDPMFTALDICTQEDPGICAVD
ncbi:MAG: substrate-binding domain-containing protein [Cucumibacter sp.]